MPFRLKKVERTYQCLMDKILEPLEERTIQVYVDDMVVTCKELAKHHYELEELFDIICKYHLKLNPEKCVSV